MEVIPHLRFLLLGCVICDNLTKGIYHCDNTSRKYRQKEASLDLCCVPGDSRGICHSFLCHPGICLWTSFSIFNRSTGQPNSDASFISSGPRPCDTDSSPLICGVSYFYMTVVKSQGKDSREEIFVFPHSFRGFSLWSLGSTFMGRVPWWHESWLILAFISWWAGIENKIQEVVRYNLCDHATPMTNFLQIGPPLTFQYCSMM